MEGSQRIEVSGHWAAVSVVREILEREGWELQDESGGADEVVVGFEKWLEWEEEDV